MLGLGKSAARLRETLTRHIGGQKITPETRAQVERALLEADFGPEGAIHFSTLLSQRPFANPGDKDELQRALSELIAKALAPFEKSPPRRFKAIPEVTMLVGVNGSGKTSAVGKLAAFFAAQGLRAMIAACDTYRAAAVSQLRVWADRADAEFFCGEEGSDAASVAYRACAQARVRERDVLLVDTAGRLHTDRNLMEQMLKISRALEKSAAHPINAWLVLDATLGQNIRRQVSQFSEVLSLNGLIITKLDSSARAGAIVGLSRFLKSPLPIRFVSSGEGTSALAPFNARTFAEALVVDETR